MKTIYLVLSLVLTVTAFSAVQPARRKTVSEVLPWIVASQTTSNSIFVVAIYNALLLAPASCGNDTNALYQFWLSPTVVAVSNTTTGVVMTRNKPSQTVSNEVAYLALCAKYGFTVDTTRDAMRAGIQISLGAATTDTQRISILADSLTLSDLGTSLLADPWADWTGGTNFVQVLP